MPERNGYKTIDLIAKELGITEDQVRALIAVLDIQSRTFPDDRRPRYYSPEDIARIQKIIESRT
jgi:DNA-binding transcriptional MerR regulator